MVFFCCVFLYFQSSLGLNLFQVLEGFIPDSWFISSQTGFIKALLWVYPWFLWWDKAPLSATALECHPFLWLSRLIGSGITAVKMPSGKVHWVYIDIAYDYASYDTRIRWMVWRRIARPCFHNHWPLFVWLLPDSAFIKEPTVCSNSLVQHLWRLIGLPQPESHHMGRLAETSPWNCRGFLQKSRAGSLRDGTETITETQGPKGNNLWFIVKRTFWQKTIRKKHMWTLFPTKPGGEEGWYGMVFPKWLPMQCFSLEVNSLNCCPSRKVL